METKTTQNMGGGAPTIKTEIKKLRGRVVEMRPKNRSDFYAIAYMAKRGDGSYDVILRLEKGDITEESYAKLWDFGIIDVDNDVAKDVLSFILMNTIYEPDVGCAYSTDVYYMSYKGIDFYYFAADDVVYLVDEDDYVWFLGRPKDAMEFIDREAFSDVLDVVETFVNYVKDVKHSP